jgi:ribosome maturation factor RimP
MSQPRGRRGGSARAESGRGSGRTEIAAPPPNKPLSNKPLPYKPVTPEHRERLRDLVEPIVTAAGYDLEDLSVSRVGRRHMLRVAVDSDSGVDLDAVASLARAISHDLDAAEAGGEELIPGEYELEVGSRGVDRPLTEPRHWRRNTGRLVQVRVRDRTVTGRVTGVDDGGVTLDVDGTPERATWADLGPGKVQVELKRLAEISDADTDDVDDDSADDDSDEDDDGEDEE